MSQIKSKFKNSITLRWKKLDETQAVEELLQDYKVKFGYKISFSTRNHSRIILTTSFTTLSNYRTHSHYYNSELNLTYFIADGYFYCTVKDVPTNQKSLLAHVSAFNEHGFGYVSTITVKHFNSDIGFTGMFIN